MPEGNPPKSRKRRMFLLKAFTVLRELEQAELCLSRRVWGKGEKVSR